MTTSDYIVPGVYKKDTFVRQHFALPNNIFGRFILAQMRKHLNRGSYELRVRTRGSAKWYVKFHDKIARWINNRLNEKIEDLERELRELIPDPWNHSEVVKLRDKKWSIWGRTRYGMPRQKHCTKLGIYLDRKRRS